MDLSSFITSLTTSFIIFVILMVLYAWLSTKPRNAVMYYPNRIRKGMDPWERSGSRTRSPFAWIQEALPSSEQDVISASCVDSAVYFVFLSTVFGIFLLSGIVLIPVLLPLSITEKNPSTVYSFDGLDKLSMAHLKEKSPRLWAYVLACYWVSLVSYVLLWKAYKHVSNLRAAALMSPEVQPEQFAILVRDIPYSSEYRSRKEQVDEYFKYIYPETFYKSLVVTENSKVNRIYYELEDCRKKIRRAEMIYADSKSANNPEGVRPTHRTGLFGLIGRKVDTIIYYNEKIDELTPKLEAAQKKTAENKQQGAAIVIFTSRLTAAAAAQSAHAQMRDTWTVMGAPEPRQILWTNLHTTYYERKIRQYVVYFIVFMTICFHMIPIGIISAFTTLPNLKRLFPFLKPVLDQTTVRTILGAYLPQLALTVFTALLPTFFLFLSKVEGIPSESHAERSASGKYFYFVVLNVFIGATIGGTLFDSLKEIEKHPKSILDQLARSLPVNASFFITYVAFKTFVGYGLEISRIVPLIIYHLKRKYWCKTEEDLRDAWLPGDLQYITKIPSNMLILTITLCYSVIAPLILPFGALYFGLGWLVFRNQILKVFVPKYESYGRMWPHIYVRIVAALLLFQVTMIAFFGIKKFYYTPLIIPLPIITLIFAFVSSKKFYGFFRSTSLEVAARHERDLKERPEMETIYKSFIPPGLYNEKELDEDFDECV